MNFKTLNLKSEAKEKAMQWCSRKECCCKEMHDKALSWGCSPNEARELLDFLIEQKFVDERRYTEAFVRDKLRFNKWGRVKIVYMLRMQNIDKKMIMDALSEIDQTEYQQILSSELQKKFKPIRHQNPFEISGKLFRFAVSKGFEPEMINEEIFKLTKKNEK